jgi:hypothetical protein
MMNDSEAGKRTEAQRTRLAGLIAISALLMSSVAFGQYNGDRDQDHARQNDRNRVTTIVPGTVIPVRTTEAIDAAKGDNRVYMGIVDQDVRGHDGRIAVRKGSMVELMVRYTRNNDLILDLDSVTNDGQRYAVRADTKSVQSQQPNDGIVGAIFGAINGGQARGQAVRVPGHTLVTFRVQRPLDVGIPDRGVMRDGSHYHDYERDGYGGYGSGTYNGQNPGNYGGQYPGNNGR